MSWTEYCKNTRVMECLVLRQLGYSARRAAAHKPSACFHLSFRNVACIMSHW
jgi:hypothetical protein